MWCAARTGPSAAMFSRRATITYTLLSAHLIGIISPSCSAPCLRLASINNSPGSLILPQFRIPHKDFLSLLRGSAARTSHPPCSPDRCTISLIFCSNVAFLQHLLLLRSTSPALNIRHSLRRGSSAAITHSVTPPTRPAQHFPHVLRHASRHEARKRNTASLLRPHRPQLT